MEQWEEDHTFFHMFQSIRSTYKISQRSLDGILFVHMVQWLWTMMTMVYSDYGTYSRKVREIYNHEMWRSECLPLHIPFLSRVGVTWREDGCEILLVLLPVQ